MNRNFVPQAQAPATRRAGSLAWLLACLLTSGCASMATPASSTCSADPELVQQQAQAHAPHCQARWAQRLAQMSQPTPPALLLLGEQHDAAAHQQWQAQTVQWLAQRQQLAALVLEMAEAGHSTQGLAATANEAQVRQALGWKEELWPWERYRAVVMAAVRAAVPVFGGNLPRQHMTQAQRNPDFDTHLSPAAWQRQQTAVREGHCNLLPERLLVPMARIQLARDQSLALSALQALQPARTVVLVAGFAHVQRQLGIPTWLPPNLEAKVAIAQAGQAQAAIEKEADELYLTPALPAHDACAELRQQWQAPPAGAGAAMPAADAAAPNPAAPVHAPAAP